MQKSHPKILQSNLCHNCDLYSGSTVYRTAPNVRGAQFSWIKDSVSVDTVFENLAELSFRGSIPIHKTRKLCASKIWRCAVPRKQEIKNAVMIYYRHHPLLQSDYSHLCSPNTGQVFTSAPVPLSPLQIKALDKELKDHLQKKPTGKNAKHGQLEVCILTCNEWLVSTNVC